MNAPLFIHHRPGAAWRPWSPVARAALGGLALGAMLLAAGCDDGPGQVDAATATVAGAPAHDHPHRPELAASHILVAFTGTVDCPAGLRRSREDAEVRARRIAVMLRTGHGDLAAMARRYSDDPTAMRNEGYLGSFGRGELAPAFERTVAALRPGEIGGPVETPYGWHVVRREPLRTVRIHHLLVAHRDARRAAPDVDRDREDARRLAFALHRKLTCEGADACDLTARFSDDPENRLVCGDLGWIEPGLLKADVEHQVFALEPGEVSRIVETDYGFHIFWRD